MMNMKNNTDHNQNYLNHKYINNVQQQEQELILSFDYSHQKQQHQVGDQQQHYHAQIQNTSKPFQGVDITQSITCSSTHHNPNNQILFSSTNHNLQCLQANDINTLHKNKYCHNPQITFSQILEIICQNQSLKVQNQTLKKKIQSHYKTTSTYTNIINPSSSIKKNHIKIFQQPKQIDTNIQLISKFQFVQTMNSFTSFIQKMKALIVLQQYCQVKSIEKIINQLMIDLENIFLQFSRQQKTYQKQISNLKKINQNLTNLLQGTDEKLQFLINQINKTPEIKNRFINGNLKGGSVYQTYDKKQKGYSPSFSSQVPYFAKTFSNSIEEIEFMSTVQQQLHHYDFENRFQIQNFVKIVFWIKQRLGKGQGHLEINPFQLAKSKKLKQIIEEIQILIENLQKKEDKIEIIQNKRNDSIQQFLKCFSSNIPHFLQKLSSINKNGEYKKNKQETALLNILLTGYISFIQIYFTQFKNKRVNSVIGSEYIGKFWRIMNYLKMKSGIQGSNQAQSYLEEMQQFLDSISQQ